MDDNIYNENIHSDDLFRDNVLEQNQSKIKKTSKPGEESLEDDIYGLHQSNPRNNKKPPDDSSRSNHPKSTLLRIWMLIAGLLTIIIALHLFLTKRSENTIVNNDKTETTITVGCKLCPALSLFTLAEKQGYFKDEGLNLEIVYFETDRELLRQFRRANFDVAILNLLPFLAENLQGNDIVMSASFGKINNMSCIINSAKISDWFADSYYPARDRNQDMTISLERYSAAHLLFSKLRKLHYIHDLDVQYLTTISQVQESALSNKILAAVLPHRIALEVMSKNTKFTLFNNLEEEIRKTTKQYGVVCHKSNFPIEKQTAIIRALISAEKYAETHQDETLASMVDKIDLTPQMRDELSSNIVSYGLYYDIRNSRCLKNRVQWLKEVPGVIHWKIKNNILKYPEDENEFYDRICDNTALNQVLSK